MVVKKAQTKLLKREKPLNVTEQSLFSFFQGVGRESAPMLELELKGNIPLMKRYPDIAKKYIHRFGNYFRGVSNMNHQAALRCLIKIATEVPETKEQIAKDLNPIFVEWRSAWEGQNEGKLLQDLTDILELPLPKKEEYLTNIARSIITLNKPIIIVIGAGFSYDILPITDELEPLLIQLLLDKGISSPAQYIRDNNEKVWNIAKESGDIFKLLFTGSCVTTEPSIQHAIVAEMLHEGMISHIISFNWDNLIERSYIKKFREEIPKITTDGIIPNQPSLWKLHGDVDDKSSKWIYPYERGYVFKSLISSILKSIKDNCPHYVLIVGYRESEVIVREELIKILKDNTPEIIRISHHLQNETDGYISETPKIFFQHLHKYIEKQKKNSP